MRHFVVVNATRGTCLATRVRSADRFVDRLVGLIGRDPAADEGLLIHPCRAVHTFGMRHPLDIAYLDDSGRIVDLDHALPPRRLSRVRRMARSVLEVHPGTLQASRCAVGDHLIRLYPNAGDLE